MSTASGIFRYDGIQVSVKSSRSPSATSKVSSWCPSTAGGRRGPVRMSLSGPAVAMMAGSPLDLLAVHPGPDLAVVEAHHPAVPDRDRAAQALDASYDVGAPVAGRHQVGDPDLPGVGGVRRLEDGGVTDVAPGGGVLAGRTEQPVTVLVGAEQPGEAGRRVELGEAEPVERPVDADQRGGVPVADGGVVLDRQRHDRRLATGGSRRRGLARVAETTLASDHDRPGHCVHAALLERGQTVGCAESLTGGELAVAAQRDARVPRRPSSVAWSATRPR